jgi:uncharacterized protein YjiS (DUF1127 family)
MAYITNNSATLEGTLSVSGRLAQLRTTLSTRLANYRIYRATLSELSALSDQELNDVGLSRGMIRDVALAAVYQA